MPPLKRWSRTIGYAASMALAWGGVGVFFLWSAGALYYFTLVPYALRLILAMAYIVGGILLFLRLKRRRGWLPIAATSIVVIYLATLVQRPSNDRDWDPSQTQTTSVDMDADRVTIHGFRHCVYRTETDFDVQYKMFDFDLDQLKKVWFLVHKFSPVEGLAHTFVTFEVNTNDGPKYFSVSVEVRREIDEEYSPVRGMYRRFELLYVIGDERDVIGLRTVIRTQDRVHMYRVNATPQEVQRLFVDIADRINKLKRDPEFYHTFLNNCTNGIVFHTYDLTPEQINWLDPRIVLPGYSDRFAFEKKLIGRTQQSFEQLQLHSRIDEVARRIGLVDEFSSELRLRRGP